MEGKVSGITRSLPHCIHTSMAAAIVSFTRSPVCSRADGSGERARTVRAKQPQPGGASYRRPRPPLNPRRCRSVPLQPEETCRSERIFGHWATTPNSCGSADTCTRACLHPRAISPRRGRCPDEGRLPCLPAHRGSPNRRLPACRIRWCSRPPLNAAREDRSFFRRGRSCRYLHSASTSLTARSWIRRPTSITSCPVIFSRRLSGPTSWSISKRCSGGTCEACIISPLRVSTMSSTSESGPRGSLQRQQIIGQSVVTMIFSLGCRFPKGRAGQGAQDPHRLHA